MYTPEYSIEYKCSEQYLKFGLNYTTYFEHIVIVYCIIIILKFQISDTETKLF